MKFSTLFKNTLKRNFLIGLIVLLPFVVTFKLFMFFLTYFDQWIDSEVPGLGLVVVLLLILLVGFLSRNYFGRLMIRWGDAGMGRIPMFRVIYGVVKRALQTYATRDRNQFSRVVLVEFPRAGSFSVGFVTGEPPQVVLPRAKKTFLNVFVPTTPNPTSGFYLIVPEEEATDLELSVEEAFQLIVSCGMVSPQPSRSKGPSYGRK